MRLEIGEVFSNRPHPEIEGMMLGPGQRSTSQPTIGEARHSTGCRSIFRCTGDGFDVDESNARNLIIQTIVSCHNTRFFGLLL